MKRVVTSIVLCFLVLFYLPASAKPSWSQWVAQLRAEALEQGIAPSLFDSLFADIRPSHRVLQFDKSQPERRLSFAKYRSTRASNYKIKLGQREYRRYKALLEEVGDAYSVDPCFIVSLWGMESSYGRFMGSFPVIKSLATLAYDDRRAKFFRRELLQALHILNEGHVTPENFKGEWAGASGQPQFLPSSWHKYAVDYDRDGRKDIWSDHADIFASIANYLKKNGWESNQPWAIPVVLPDNFDKDLSGKKNIRAVSRWNELGIRTVDGEQLPYMDLDASIVMPYGGPAILAFNNFNVILRYNNSIYYGGTIGYMADKICQRYSTQWERAPLGSI